MNNQQAVQRLKASLLELETEFAKTGVKSAELTRSINALSKMEKANCADTVQMRRAYNTLCSNMQVVQTQTTAMAAKMGILPTLFAKVGNAGKAMFSAMGGWVTIAITAITMLIEKIVDVYEEAEARSSKLNEIEAKSAASAENHENKINALVDAINNENTSEKERETLLGHLQKLYPNVNDYIDENKRITE